MAEKGSENKIKVQAEALKNLDTKDFIYHQKEVEEVLKELNTSLSTGLTDSEVEKRLK